MKRFQARHGNGRWTRNTFENSLGLNPGICPSCNRFNPTPVGEMRPETCTHCGNLLATCAHGRCADPFPDPATVRNNWHQECGKPALAFDVKHRWPVCAEHA